MADIFIFDGEHVSRKNLSQETLKRNLKKKLLWIDIPDHQKEVFDMLVPFYKFHHLVVEDAVLEIKTLPKIEEFRSYNFLITYGLNLENNTIKKIELDFFIGKNFIISSYHEEIPSFQRLKKDPIKLAALIKKGPDFLLHKLIDLEVDKQILVLDDAEDLLDNLASRIISQRETDMFSAFFDAKNELRNIKKILSLQSQVIEHISKKPVKFFTEDMRPYFRDTFDHTIRVLDMVERQREMIDNNIQIYFSLASTRMNEIIKVLTTVATIVLPLTLISSIYGMNFEYMPELSSRYGYPAILAFMSLVALGMIFYFKKKRWV